MNGTKSLFACVLLVLLGSAVLLAQAPSPEGDAPLKPATKAEPKPAGKPAAAETPNSDKADAASAKLCQCVGRDSSAAAKRIEQILAAPLHKTGLDYADQPLQDVVTQLTEEYNIPIQMNKNALEEAAIGTDSRINVNLHNISLRAALKITLRRLQLTWVIQDEVLMITTNEDAEKDLVVCVYNIQGLVDETDTKSIDSLIDTIVSCAATDTWAENGGGQAEIRLLQPGLLVISQTQAIHRQIKGLLAQIRKMREQVPVVKGLPQSSGRSRGRSSSSTSNSKTAQGPKPDDSNTHKDPAKK